MVVALAEEKGSRGYAVSACLPVKRVGDLQNSVKEIFVVHE